MSGSVGEYEKVRIVTRTVRRPVALAFALIATLVLTACGSGPSQVGAAAIVGDHVIPLDDVQQEMRWRLDSMAQEERQQFQADNHGRELVRTRIVHHLLNIVAEREGLQPDQDKVDRIIENSGGAENAASIAGIAPDQVSKVLADHILLQQLGEHYLDRLSVRLVGTMIVEEDMESTAEEQARSLGELIAANPDDAAQVVQDSGYQLVEQELSFEQALQEQPALATSAVFGAQEGTVLMIQPHPRQAVWLVALVQERAVDAASEQDGDTEMNPQVLHDAGLRQLQPLADELGVRVNPRYGVWDSTVMAPVPSEEQKAGYQLLPQSETS